MAVDIRIPELGESITEGVIVRWIKGEGEAVAIDEPLLELETDKASVEIPAEKAGVLHIVKPEGETVEVGDVIATIEEGTGTSASPKETGEAPPADESASKPDAEPADAPASAGAATPSPGPAVRKLLDEHDIDPTSIEGTGKGGRITKGDVLAHIENSPADSGPASAASTTEPAPAAPKPESSQPASQSTSEPTAKSKPSAPARVRRPEADGPASERVPMSRLRQRIATRLVQAQQDAAILTTFNEVDMTEVMNLRKRHKEKFKETHGVSLGFMSFFARAAVGALQDVPIANAQIDGTDVVYHRHVNLGVAVASERGLIVPVIHQAETLSFAEIESEITRLATLARDNKLGIPDLTGGTFTISNGGVFGSLMSTPILNPPQSAILGMHKIEKRPVVVDDEIVIRPMMYLALSYDHRLIDGEQAVTVLVRIKERLEDPTRLLLGV